MPQSCQSEADVRLAQRGRDRIAGNITDIPRRHATRPSTWPGDDGRHRFLFTGDFIWVEGGEWKAVVLDPAVRDQYLASLALVRELDFDVLVPRGVTEGDPAAWHVRDDHDRRARIDRIIPRVAAGAQR